MSEPSFNAKASAPVGQLLSEVTAERVRWLWQKRIPVGKLTILDGDTGLGKSALLTDAAARVTMGRPWPNGTPCEAGGVVICSAEDGLADTIRPRLDAAGGDPSKVLAIATIRDADGERLLSIPGDLDVLRRGIERVDAKLVIADPLMAFLSGKMDSHKDQHVRRALAPTAKMAEETGAAILVVRHLTKEAGGNNPLYRGGGSIGIAWTARSALLVAKHPEDDQQRVLAPLKNNLSEPAPSLAFVLTEAANGAVTVEFKGATSLTAAALLTAPLDPEEKSALVEAKEFIREALGEGPVPATQVDEDARAAKISGASLRRAKKALGVRSVKEGAGTWSWALPEEDAQEEQGGQGEQAAHGGQQGPHAQENERLEHLDHLPVDETNRRAQGVRQAAQSPQDERLREAPIGTPDSSDHAGQDAQGAQDEQAAAMSTLPPWTMARSCDEDPGNVGSAADEVDRLFSDPPEWLRLQTAEYVRQGMPGRLLNPLANAVSTELYGSPWRGQEILPAVEQRLREEQGGL